MKPYDVNQFHDFDCSKLTLSSFSLCFSLFELLLHEDDRICIKCGIHRGQDEKCLSECHVKIINEHDWIFERTIDKSFEFFDQKSYQISAARFTCNLCDLKGYALDLDSEYPTIFYEPVEKIITCNERIIKHIIT
jgi:hypothetical protein